MKRFLQALCKRIKIIAIRLVAKLPTPRQKERFFIIAKDWLSRCYYYWFFPIDKSPLTGRFLSATEQAEILLKHNDGVCITSSLRLSQEATFRHFLVLGGTGSGKSANVFIPSLLQLGGALIILDASGDLFERTSGFLSKSRRVLQLNLSHPQASEGYNPMLRVKTDGQMKRLASTLVQTSLPRSNETFWPKTAEQVLFSLIKIVKESAPLSQQNLTNVLHLLNNLSYKKNTLGFDWIAANARPEAFSIFKGAMAGTENTVNAVLAVCRTALEKLSDPELARVLSHDTLGDLREIRTTPTALFISLKETDIKYLSFIVSIIMTDLLDMAMEMGNNPPLYFLLDEWGHFYVDGFISALTTLRKRNVGVVMSAQSKSMFESQYGEADATTLMSGGVASTLILAGQNDARANQEISTLLGDRIVEYKGKTMVRPLLSPDEVFALKDQGIFLHAGHRAALLNLSPFYKNRHLSALTTLPPVQYSGRNLPDVELLNLSDKSPLNTSALIDVS